MTKQLVQRNSPVNRVSPLPTYGDGLLILLTSATIIFLAVKKIASAPAQITVPSPEPVPIPEPIPYPISYPIPEPIPELTNPLLERKGSLKWPWEYKPEGECELIAKTYQKEYGGYLVYLSPYDTLTGAWIMGDYAGQWLNLVGGLLGLYVDYQAQSVFNNQSEVIQYYTNVMKSKFNTLNVSVKVYIYGVDDLPYPIIWHF